MKELDLFIGVVKQLPLWFWLAMLGGVLMAGLTVSQLLSYLVWLFSKKN